MRRAWLLTGFVIVPLAGASSDCASLDGLSGGADAGGVGDGERLDGPADREVAGDGGGDAGVDGAPGCDPGSVPGLVAYYPFDEGKGSVVHDCSGKGRDGTILRVAANTWTAGIKGGGLHVASPDGCVDLGNVPELVMTGSFTVMAWANTANFPSSVSSPIVGKSSDLTVSGWRMYAGFVQEYGAGVALLGGSGLFVGKEPLPAAVWTHLTTTFEPTKALTFFVDGVNVAQKAWTATMIDDSAANVRIGCRSDNTGFYDGVIDEVRIYARLLTPTEIALLSAKSIP